MTVEAAGEALADPDRLVIDPDYASQSERSVRSIGWSASESRLLTIITVSEDDVVYGVNGLAGQRNRHPPLPRAARGREP